LISGLDFVLRTPRFQVLCLCHESTTLFLYNISTIFALTAKMR
jgi:hypothetical protein